MDKERLEVGALLQRVWAAVCAASTPVIAYLVGLSALGVAVDLTAGEGSGAFLLSGVAGLVAGYLLLRSMLGRCGLLREGEGGGFGVYFGVSLLAGLGIILGFVLLIIPGLIFLVRWQAALAFALSEDEGVSGSLEKSWDMTSGHFWPIFSVMLIGLVPIALSVVALGTGLAFMETDTGNISPPIAEVIATNLVGNAYSVFSTALSVAVYWILRRERQDISEVFA